MIPRKQNSEVTSKHKMETLENGNKDTYLNGSTNNNNVLRYALLFI